MTDHSEESAPLEEAVGQAELPPVLPVLPLRETVVFPAAMSPLAIGQERSIKLVDDAVAGDRMVALLTSTNPEIEAPGPRRRSTRSARPR